jgi:hypothetical protein
MHIQPLCTPVQGGFRLLASTPHALTDTTDTTPLLPQACFGAVVTTRAVALDVHPLTVLALLSRHFRNDWGDLDPEDVPLNRQAIQRADCDRVMSAYNDTPMLDGSRRTVWIISYVCSGEEQSDPDCCNTCVLFPEDY